MLTAKIDLKKLNIFNKLFTDVNAFEGVDAVIHLAGENIASGSLEGKESMNLRVDELINELMN